eukprot:Rhum_TRINITY_DN15248_c3_g1::Rhum_TRINITY_DN15248_c3_g1_i1::g.143839::m.143839/K02318/COASY; phosphopantetheine adenylyltransferase / dephospho-CoA kinase
MSKGRLVVGVYGGICSGKSLACKVLSEMGAGVVDLDKMGHRAYSVGTPCCRQVLDVFPAAKCAQTGGVDRAALGAIVFGDASGEKMSTLNGIVWPEIGRLADEEMERLSALHDWIALEGALLMEGSGRWHEKCSHLWLFHVRKEVAVQRMMEARNLTRAEAEDRLGKQPDNEARAALAREHFTERKTLWICDRSDTTKEEAERAIRRMGTRLVLRNALQV